jgi:hypothetical protein
MTRLKTNLRRMGASLLRATVATVGATQGFNVLDGRGWNGALQALGVACVPPILVFITASADQLDP